MVGVQCETRRVERHTPTRAPTPFTPHSHPPAHGPGLDIKPVPPHTSPTNSDGTSPDHAISIHITHHTHTPPRPDPTTKQGLRLTSPASRITMDGMVRSSLRSQGITLMELPERGFSVAAPRTSCWSLDPPSCIATDVVHTLWFPERDSQWSTPVRTYVQNLLSRTQHSTARVHTPQHATRTHPPPEPPAQRSAVRYQGPSAGLMWRWSLQITRSRERPLSHLLIMGVSEREWAECHDGVGCVLHRGLARDATGLLVGVTLRGAIGLVLAGSRSMALTLSRRGGAHSLAVRTVLFGSSAKHSTYNPPPAPTPPPTPPQITSPPKTAPSSTQTSPSRPSTPSHTPAAPRS